MKVAAIIPAAGKGERFGLKKQFHQLSGKLIIDYSLEAMFTQQDIKQIVLAVPAEDLNWVKEEVVGAKYGEKVEVIKGGATRQETVELALGAVLPSLDVILIHDGARPFITEDLISFIIAGAYHLGAVVPGIAVNDTIKEVDDTGRVSKTIPRDSLRAIQTPQGFRQEIIREAYLQAAKQNWVATDDAGLVELAGFPVYVLPGKADNIKITNPSDLNYAKPVLGKQGLAEQGLRIGLGTDIHPLVVGREFVLGGVKIPFDKGCQAHSDGDVLFHALMDALLGAAGMADIGTHYPDTKEKYLNIASSILLEDVYRLLQNEGWRIGNIDCTIMLERPKIADFIPAMKQNIAKILFIAPSQVNIKATTAEKLGFIGCGEGVMAQAIALLFS